ncbi:hypothetical protein OESDEN_09663 [Oesophagostomum dentatum]|uniref:Uncharacterized protein n=1 Tax=Oesophagostomum dentatum TaxID=61180 RepID=A0A0B1T519_OESDE|nr:hypothetical protein OESDEN_09663 [Oesophagostomum dentatum]
MQLWQNSCPSTSESEESGELNGSEMEHEMELEVVNDENVSVEESCLAGSLITPKLGSLQEDFPVIITPTSFECEKDEMRIRQPLKS